MAATCRSCESGDLLDVISLGPTPLANALLDDVEDVQRQPTYPLDVRVCRDCSLMQIDPVTSPEQLFSDYVYRTSVSDTMVAHAHALATRMVEDRKLGPENLVVEAASNDGYLLRAYRDLGVGVLGIEPAANIASVASDDGIPTRTAFFTRELGETLAGEGSVADVFHAHNVLAHVPDLNGFVAGIERVLSTDGVAVVETPYVRDLVDGCEFDTIYHEHLSYFSLTAIDRCFRRNDLSVLDVEHVPVHGGSLRVFGGRAARSQANRVRELLEQEASWGVTSEATYHRFAERVRRLRERIHDLLERLRTEGRRVAAYGASAKATTLLAYCGIGRDTIEFVVDRSPHKQGRFLPADAIPILPPEALVQRMPDYTLLLAWNFVDEVVEQQAEYRRRGGRFIVPIPELRVV